jgi:hypothetical protein
MQRQGLPKTADYEKSVLTCDSTTESDGTGGDREDIVIGGVRNEIAKDDEFERQDDDVELCDTGKSTIPSLTILRAPQCRLCLDRIVHN